MIYIYLTMYIVLTYLIFNNQLEWDKPMPSPDTDPQNLGQPNVHAIALVNGHRHHLVDPRNPGKIQGEIEKWINVNYLVCNVYALYTKYVLYTYTHYTDYTCYTYYTYYT